MHRSRLHVLVVLAAVAACSAPKDPERTKSLARDTALVAHVADFKDSDTQTANAFPDACGTFTIPSPTAAHKTQAQGLARRAYNAEILGKVSEASSLLREASQLDATDKSAAYHLGRVSEAMNDSGAAIAAYCRYLALAPTKSEQLEARQRVVELAQSQTHSQAQAQAQSQLAVAPPSAPRTHSPVETTPRVVAKRPVDASTHTRPTREIHSTTAIASGAVDLPRQTAPASAPATTTTTTTTTTSAGEPTAKIDAGTNPGDGVDTPAPLPTVEQPRTDQRGPSRVQSAGIGAVAGAIIGRVAGRDMKSAAIGAVAGGILGAVVVHPRGTGGFAPRRWPRG